MVILNIARPLYRRFRMVAKLAILTQYVVAFRGLGDPRDDRDHYFHRRWSVLHFDKFRHADCTNTAVMLMLGCRNAALRVDPVRLQDVGRRACSRISPKPHSFCGESGDWHDWKYVFVAFVVALMPEIDTFLQLATGGGDEELPRTSPTRQPALATG